MIRKIQNIFYNLQYDITRNRYIEGDLDSCFHGVTLMFHNVTDENVDADDNCKCKINEFSLILEQYKRAGYRFVSLDDAINIIKNKYKEKFVVVTFDDIPDNVYENAYPILKEQNIPFVIFVTFSFIGKESFISKSKLEALIQDQLCTVGAHSMTHPMLRNIKNSKWEIEQSKIELESLLKRPIKYFAYPYGRFSSISQRVIKEVQAAGYESAFSSISAPLTEVSTDNLFFLPRVVPKVGKVNIFNKEWSIIGIIIRFISKPLQIFLRKS